MGAAAGVGADQHPPPLAAGQLARASRVTSMCSAAVLDPALPSRSKMASGQDPRQALSSQAKALFI
jgi:hypothetical protein